jgi:hypothetical protein
VCVGGDEASPLPLDNHTHIYLPTEKVKEEKIVSTGLFNCCGLSSVLLRFPMDAGVGGANDSSASDESASENRRALEGVAKVLKSISIGSSYFSIKWILRERRTETARTMITGRTLTLG